MKFSIGDKVLLKRTGEDGIVAGYISPDMFEVEAGGTTFPVHADDMEHPYLKWFTEKKQEKRSAAPPEQLPVEKEKFPAARLAKGVYLSFLPVYRLQDMEDVVERLKIFLVNELALPVRYSYDVRIAGSSLFAHEGSLSAFGHVYLHHIPYETMNDQPRFHWLLSAAAEAMASAPAAGALRDRVAGEGAEVSGVLRIRPARLFAELSELQRKNEPMFSYLLTDTLTGAVPERPQTPVRPERRSSAVPAAAVQEQPRYEVDLHIEQLVPDTGGLSNTDMLQIQLAHLRHYLRLAVAHRMDRMIVVHGLGKGVLRDAVHRMLRETPEVERFTNEWMGKYGFGATEIRFSY